MTAAIDDQVHDQIPRHAKQPTAKGAFRPIGVPLFDSRRDRHEHLLSQVAGVGVLQPEAAKISVDDAPVDTQELVPRLGVFGVADPEYQARPGRRRFVHGLSTGTFVAPGSWSFALFNHMTIAGGN